MSFAALPKTGRNHLNTFSRTPPAPRLDRGGKNLSDFFGEVKNGFEILSHEVAASAFWLRGYPNIPRSPDGAQVVLRISVGGSIFHVIVLR